MIIIPLINDRRVPLDCSNAHSILFQKENVSPNEGTQDSLPLKSSLPGTRITVSSSILAWGGFDHGCDLP